MREIDCVHSQSVKMLLWSWFRENINVSTYFILVLGLKRRCAINNPRWCSDKIVAYWSQRSRVRIPLVAKKFFASKNRKFAKISKWAYIVSVWISFLYLWWFLFIENFYPILHNTPKHTHNHIPSLYINQLSNVIRNTNICMLCDLLADLGRNRL
jgi:hypothetical protein